VTEEDACGTVTALGQYRPMMAQDVGVETTHLRLGHLLGSMSAKRTDSLRWFMLVPAIGSSFLATLGIEDEGVRGVAHLILFALVCIAHIVWPSILGWALAFVPTVIYLALVTASVANGRSFDSAFFLGLALLLASTSCVARPSAKSAADVRATLLAVGFAVVAEGWVFLL
jgi:hypothetical protein